MLCQGLWKLKIRFLTKTQVSERLCLLIKTDAPTLTRLFRLPEREKLKWLKINSNFKTTS